MADKRIKIAGMPLVIPEGQASGIGVCIQNVWDGYKDFIGGAG